MITFEEYSKIQFDDLKKSLSAFPEKDIKKYWEDNQKKVREAYEEYKRQCEERGVEISPLSDLLSYSLALDF